MLRPDTPKEGKVRELRPGESRDQLGEPLRTYASEAGLVMRRPPLVSYTMYALEATEYAKDHGKFLSFHNGLYEAYWGQGKDLGDIDVLLEVAGASGLDTDALGDRLESRHYEDAVMTQYREAAELGIRGIPAFLIGKYLFTGARPYQDFQEVMNRTLADEGDS